MDYARYQTDPEKAVVRPRSVGKRTAPRRPLQIGLFITLLIFSVGATYIELSASVINPAKPALVILPGREGLVMRLLESVLKTGFSGRKVSDILLQNGEIRLQLDSLENEPTTGPAGPCLLPQWAKPPGIIVIAPRIQSAASCSADMHCNTVEDGDLRLTWKTCAESNGSASAAHWIQTLARTNHDGIWEKPPPIEVAYSEKNGGLLAPLVLMTGLEKSILVRYLLFVSIAMSVIAGFVLRKLLGPSPEPNCAPTPLDFEPMRLRWFSLGIMLLLGIGLRLYAAVVWPHDVDERLAVQEVLSGNHDSWVHPPLYGIVNNAWINALHLDLDSPIWHFRIPSLLFSVLTLGFLAWFLGFSRRNQPMELPFALVALSPTLIFDGVLARPYSLAMFGSTLCLLAIASRDLFDTKKEDWVSWLVALIALGLTAWTDALTALLVGTFVLARWLHPDGFPRKAWVWGRIVTAASVFCWAGPFVLGLPGSVQASKEIGWPYDAPDAHASTLAPIANLLQPMVGDLYFHPRPNQAAGTGLAVLGIAFAVAILKMKRSSSALGLGLMLVTVVVVSHYMGLRTRNLVFLPVAFAVVGAVVAPRFTQWEIIRQKWRARTKKN